MSKIDELLAQHCPDGVEFLTIGDVVQRTTNLKWDERRDEEIQYIDLSSVDRVTRRISETSTVDRDSAPSRAQQEVRTGDVLFGTTRPMLKRYCLVGENYDGQVASTGFCVLRPIERITSEWLYHMLGTPDFYRYVEVNQRGASYPAISDTLVKDFKIPVPPMEVQREIASFLDKLESLTAELESELESELEYRSRQYSFYRDQLLTFGEAEGVRWATLDELYESSSGLSKSADQFGFGHPFLSFRDVFHNRVVPSTLSGLVNTTEAEQVRYSIKAGDVFVTRTSEDLKGLGMSSAALMDYPKATFNGFTKRLRPKQMGLVEPSYAAYFFRSSLFRTQIARMAVLSTRVSLNDDILLRIRIAVPAVKEQQRVVAILDNFDKLVNDLSIGLPAEIAARRTQYEYYRDKLLTFEEAA